MGQSFTFRPLQRTSATECRSGPKVYVSGARQRPDGFKERVSTLIDAEAM